MQVFASSIPAPELTVNGKFDLESYTKREDEYRAAVIEEAKSHGEHKLAGQIVRTPFADGYAEYVVAKVNGKVSLIHLESMDAWHDDQWCRLMTVKELTRVVEARKKLAEIFGG